MQVRTGLQSIVIADENDRDALQQLLELVNHTADDELSLTGPEGESYRLTDSIQFLLQQAVAALAQDRAVALQTIPAAVSVNMAASILNVPTNFVRTLLSDGELIAGESFGGPLIPLRELLDYKQRRDADRHEALSELTRLSQEFGLYE